MTINFFKTLVIHEGMVFRRTQRMAAGSNGLGVEGADFFPPFAAQTDNDFFGFLRLCDGLVDQGLKKGSVVSTAWMVSPTAEATRFECGC